MQDFEDRLTIKISGKNHHALLAFLKKHGAGKEDISRFVEEAIVWRMLDRELAFRHSDGGTELFTRPEYEEEPQRLSA